MADRVLFKLRAAPSPTDRLPRAFEGSLRSAADTGDDPFLPRGLLHVDQAFDLSGAARATEAGRQQREVAPAPGQVVVLELPDGLTVITHPDNLRDTLARIDPQSVDADGAVVFEQALRSRGASLRGSFGDAVSDGLSAIVTQVYTLTVGQLADPIIDAAKRKACEWLGEKAEEKIEQYADLGVSWAGTKALMWAIESRLKRDPGLYRWVDGTLTDRFDAGDPRLAAEATAGPLLVMIHGTGSSTSGSFDALQSASRSYWTPFEARYGERVFAFEHRSLSESPIDNALQLARALPAGAAVHLVTHSRGGLVGDLLCLENFNALIDGYALEPSELGEADPSERERLRGELLKAHAEQRNALHELAAELRRKKLRIERYVRVACPARGTRLASGNFDVFLSALLSLMGWVPAFKGNPIYSAFKRVVLEVAKNRTKPQLVPGIEAMLPGSPMARLLARASSQDGVKLAVISGDIEGGGWLKRLSVLFTDFTFFDSTDNDLVVDTDSMVAGVARSHTTRVLFDQGPEVNHFRYFVNETTRSALRSWLTEASVEQIAAFKPLRGIEPTLAELTRGRRTRAATAAALPVTVMLPGIMGSHLWLNRRDRVWFDISTLALGGLAKLRMAPGAKKDTAEAESLFAQFYGDLVQHLECTQRVVPFAYDWRQPLDVLADRLAAVLRAQLDASAAPAQPLRVLAHSMGGLVVRALVHKHPALWDELMARDGARFVMLGTPNQGSHLMVETLIGKSDTVRKLGVLDLAHDLQEVIDIIASFPGALQLLPKPGFVDTGNEHGADYFDPAIWGGFKKDMRDLWFGDGIGALPTPQTLQQAQWLWAQDRKARPALPGRHESKVAYVAGCAAKTPCGIVREGERWKMLGTHRGDGSVTWDSGRIDGIGQFFYMPAEHGALADTEDYFDSIAGLLDQGTGGMLMTSPPAVREALDRPLAATYDAGPVPYPTDTEAAAGLFGAGKRVRSRERREDVLSVRVKAMDVRQVTQPVLVGHYEQDAISGPEALIDRHLVHGELSMRHHLGLYAGPIGTATAVLLGSTAQERQRGSLRGAVVAGLGKYDGSLTAGKLTEAVRTAGLRYLLHVLDMGAVAAGTESAGGVKLASLLLGYNSAANLSIADSVQALVRGIVEANRHFGQTTSSQLRITCLEIVEIYLDSAITAAYAAREVARTMNADKRIGCRIEADPLLHQGDGVRQRLYDVRRDTYWPRLMITDADARPDGAAPNPAEASSPTRRRLAERLHYLFLGPRARAESIVQQRQPGLVERLVESQVTTLGYDADFSRTLFQLLVPHDFKDAARQVQQMVFVLDGHTANLPWELMMADDQPLATRTAMVRQLSSSAFRLRVNQSMERRAYVVGNPSTEGFYKAFPDPRMASASALDDLPGAEKEGRAVIESLARNGFQVERAVGREQHAIDIVNRLYRAPYRIVHVAGHGVYDERPDGDARSGVVLSDGLMISAAEIDAMEVVPDLVFLNCCHLGQVDRSPVAFNKLAHSVARQLIDIGVRAVVVAGWAVEDAPASLFAETFYEKLLAEQLSFGEAVFGARRATWERYPTSITWAAYQAYGDPGWRADPKIDAQSSRSSAGSTDVAPEELLDRLESEQQAIQRSAETLSRVEARRIATRVQQWVDATPSGWVKRPDLLSAAADLYADLGPGYFEQACALYQRAIVAADGAGRVPIRAIEQLGNVEARLGEQTNDAELVARGIARLEQLVRVTGDPLPGEAAGPGEREVPANAERAALIGSAWKRKAAVHARAYLHDGHAAEFTQLREALTRSTEAYYTMASRIGDKEVRPYQTLNWLFLWSLAAAIEERTAYVPHAQRCAAAANAAFAEDPAAYNSTMVADAALVAALLDGSLAAAAGRDAAIGALAISYENAMRVALITPRERDSVVGQIRLMALFHHAYAKHGKTPQSRSLGVRLDALADRLGAADSTPEPAPDDDAAADEAALAAPAAPKPAPKRTRAVRKAAGPAARRR
ncbi:CHAT domain-containing protein [Piscinibacter sp.]|uniref:CHAT domain-containing protein n=1 Tax=Piscinibacter sp. TaxID=1903157 RepID=UPI002BBDD9BA|nr:CHAT domain-containing protein [Albitalea sp.]HUG21790.1 CHAT domain-containing protein [Albitalea sp.]